MADAAQEEGSPGSGICTELSLMEMAALPCCVAFPKSHSHRRCAVLACENCLVGAMPISYIATWISPERWHVLCTHFPRRLPSQSPLQLPYLCCSNTYDTMSRCMVQSFHHMSSISATSQSIGTFLLICFIAHPISHAERVLKVTGTVKVNGTTTSPKLHIAQF